MADALRKQSLVINSGDFGAGVQSVVDVVSHVALSYSGVFVNLATGRTNPIPINAATWARFGYDAPKPPVKKTRKPAKAKVSV